MPADSSDTISQTSHASVSVSNYYWDINNSTPIGGSTATASIIGITSDLGYVFIDSEDILIPFYSGLIYCSTEDLDLEYSIVFKGESS